MTKTTMRTRLTALRDECWDKALAYDNEYKVQLFPEQRARHGGLELKDVRFAEMRGIVFGIDLAMSRLDIKR